MVANIPFEVKIPTNIWWVTIISQTETSVKLKVDANTEQQERTAVIDFQQVNNGLAKRSLTLKQKAYTYQAIIPDGLPRDTTVAVTSAATSSYQPGAEAAQCIDGNMHTTCHSHSRYPGTT